MRRLRARRDELVQEGEVWVAKSRQDKLRLLHPTGRDRDPAVSSMSTDLVRRSIPCKLLRATCLRSSKNMVAFENRSEVNAGEGLDLLSVDDPFVVLFTR